MITPSCSTRTSRSSVDVRPAATLPTAIVRPGCPVSARRTAHVWTEGVNARITMTKTSAAKPPRITSVSFRRFMT